MQSRDSFLEYMHVEVAVYAFASKARFIYLANEGDEEGDDDYVSEKSLGHP